MGEPSSSAAPEPVYTVADIAAALRVGNATVHRWIKAGVLDAFKIGREYRVRESQRDAFFVHIGLIPTGHQLVDSQPAEGS